MPFLMCNINLTDTQAALDEMSVRMGETLVYTGKIRQAVREAGAEFGVWYYVEVELTAEGDVIQVHTLELQAERDKRLRDEDAQKPYPREWQNMPDWRLHFRTLRPADDLNGDPRLGYGHTETGFHPLKRVLEREREVAVREGRAPDEAFIRSLFEREPHLEFKNGTRINSMEALVGTVAINEETREKLVSYVCHDLTSTTVFSKGLW